MNFLDIPPMDVYRIVAWLGWGLNLIIAEIYIQRMNKSSTAVNNIKRD
jgi:short subunit fatty acids transporter